MYAEAQKTHTDDYYIMWYPDLKKIYFDHSSPMYCCHLENKINELAGEKITEIGPSGFMGLTVSFYIDEKYMKIFETKCLPHFLFVPPNIIKY